MAFQVVLDTCVIVPLPLRDTLLELAAGGLYVPKWSERSLASMERLLIEKRDLDARQASDAKLAMTAAFDDATVPAKRIAALEPAMTNPLHDRHVLAAAVAVNAAKIVTFNVDDFPVSACEPVGVEALTPDEFLTDLLGVAPGAVAEGLQRQAARLRRPPITLETLLELLTPSAPSFVESLRPLLAHD